MRKSVAICLLATLLAGCSNIDRFDIPRDPATGQLTPESIVRRFKCELAVIALAAENSPLKNYADTNDFIIGAQLDLAVTDDGSLAPTFTYMQNPMFSLNAGAKYEISRAQTWTARLFFSIADIRTEARRTGPDNPYHPARCPKVDTLLAGDLGVVQSVEMALNTPDLATTSTKLSGTSGVFGGSVNFMVTKNLNAVGPTYMLTHFKGPGSLAGISELNNDKITFAFAARKATDTVPAAQRASGFLDTLILGQISNQLAKNRSQF